MLSDEEKTALEFIKINNKHKYCDKDDVDFLLNLIEKQSKEIEHQIEKRANQRNELAILNAKQVEFNKLVNTVNSYKGQFKRQQKEIEELKQNIHLKEVYVLKTNDYIKGTNIEDELCNKKWKDKIKAIIEELQEDIKYRANPLSIDNLKFGIKVLQSLLEKE